MTEPRGVEYYLQQEMFPGDHWPAYGLAASIDMRIEQSQAETVFAFVLVPPGMPHCRMKGHSGCIEKGAHHRQCDRCTSEVTAWAWEGGIYGRVRALMAEAEKGLLTPKKYGGGVRESLVWIASVGDASEGIQGEAISPYVRLLVWPRNGGQLAWYEHSVFSLTKRLGFGCRTRHKVVVRLPGSAYSRFILRFCEDAAGLPIVCEGEQVQRVFGSPDWSDIPGVLCWPKGRAHEAGPA